MEITEDAEENVVGKDEAQQQFPGTDTRQRSFSQLSEATVVPSRVISNVEHAPSCNGEPSVLNEVSDTASIGQASAMTWDHSAGHSAAQKHFLEELSQPSYERRKSSQSARPALRDLERAYTPKVKRGPRPSVDMRGRPRTAGSMSRSHDQRPVASLPPCVRTSSRQSNNSDFSRPLSQPSSAASVPGKRAPPVPPLLLVPPPSMTSISRPPLSPGTKSMSAVSSTGMTPEKERLMKALHLRRKQMEKQAQEEKRRQHKNTEEKHNNATTMHANQDQENLSGHTREMHEQQTRASDQDKKPSADPQPPATTSTPAEPNDELKPASLNSSQPESAVDMPISACNNHGDHQPSTTVTDGDDATLSTNCNGSSATVQQSSQTLHQAETETPEGESTVSEQTNANDSPHSSNKGVGDFPLEGNSSVPEQETALSSRQTENPPTAGEHATDAQTKVPGSIPLPESPSDNSQPSSADKESVTVATEAPGPQHDPIPESSGATQENGIDQKQKRNPHLEHIQTPTPESADDGHLLSDDALAEELKNAKVEEAKPVSVPESPLSTPHANNSNDQKPIDAWRNSRVVSNPATVGRVSSSLQALSAGRSVSSSYSDNHNNDNRPTTPVLMARKINVSSGISSRIKALEKFSNSRETHPHPSHNLNAPPASSFEGIRKRASISLSPGHPDVVALSRRASYMVPSPSVNTLSRPPSQRGHDTASVTTRIVRDPKATPSNEAKAAEPSEPNAPRLQPSPLTIERDNSERAPPQSSTTDSPTTNSEKHNTSTPPSVGSPSSPSAAGIPRPESGPSLSPRSNAEATPPRSTSDLSLSPEEKKESRTSRLFRRVSSITSNSRKSVMNALSPTREKEGKEGKPASLEKNHDPTPAAHQAVEIGEVNVQFPDTLLWKRRFMRIDEQGYLVLTPGNKDSNARNMTKRYHLSEFKTPCLPDEDMQELPNSILLDFLDGSSLQCACESRQGQDSILRSK